MLCYLLYRQMHVVHVLFIVFVYVFTVDMSMMSVAAKDSMTGATKEEGECFVHCIDFHSSIYGFWLSLLCLQTFLSVIYQIFQTYWGVYMNS